MQAADIVTAAIMHKWQADSTNLIWPCFIGPSLATLFPIKFESIPEAHKDALISAVRKYVNEELDPIHRLALVDLWELQYKTAGEGPWKFDGSFVAVICIGCFLPEEEVSNIVQPCPGWLHWDDKHLIRLKDSVYFLFCISCKPTAQNLTGLN